MPIFNKPITKNELAYITVMPRSTFFRRLKEMPNKPAHNHHYSPKEAEDLLTGLGFPLEGEILRRALFITGQKPPE